MIGDQKHSDGNVSGPDIEERALSYLVAEFSHKDEEDSIMRTVTSAVHLLCDSPLLAEMEAVGKADPNYSQILHSV